MTASPLDEDTGDDLDNTAIDQEATTTPCLTRGLNPRAALAWVRKHHGEPGVWKVLEALDDDDDRVLGGGRVSAPTWVPFLAHARLLHAIDATFGAGDLTLLRDVGRFMCQRDFPLVARPLLRLASPGFFLDKAMRLWRLYHSHGRWEMTRTDGEVRAVLVGHPDSHPAFCATFLGWMEGALMLTGAHGVSSQEVRCATKGAPCCSYTTTWMTGARDVRARVPRPPS